MKRFALGVVLLASPVAAQLAPGQPALETTQQANLTQMQAMNTAQAATTTAVNAATTAQQATTAAVTAAQTFAAHDAEAFNNGRSFAFFTGIQAVSANNNLVTVITNPATETRTLCLVLRDISNSQNVVLEYAPRLNPNMPSGVTTVAPNNRLIGNGGTTKATVSYAVQTASLTGGTSGAPGIIAPLGTTRINDFVTGLPPGYSLGYTIGGSGGGLAASARIGMEVSAYMRAGGC